MIKICVETIILFSAHNLSHLRHVLFKISLKKYEVSNYCQKDWVVCLLFFLSALWVVNWYSVGISMTSLVKKYWMMVSAKGVKWIKFWGRIIVKIQSDSLSVSNRIHKSTTLSKRDVTEPNTTLTPQSMVMQNQELLTQEKRNKESEKPRQKLKETKGNQCCVSAPL